MEVGLKAQSCRATAEGEEFPGMSWGLSFTVETKTMLTPTAGRQAAKLFTIAHGTTGCDTRTKSL